MHRTIAYLSKRVFQIREGEGRKVFLTFLYFFLAITAYYLIKPVSRAFVLNDLGHKMVPYMDLICALVMGPIVTLFARSVDRFSKERLVTLSFWMITGVMLLFWRLLEWKQGWTAAAFYVWVSIFSVLVVTLFWLVANDLYRPRDAKRLFGLIGTGGILGGITGSWVAAIGAKLVGAEQLLLLSAGCLILCWLTVKALWRAVPDRFDAHPSQDKKESFWLRSGGFFRTVTQSRYFLFLVTLVALNKLISTLIAYQLNPFIEQQFVGVDAKTAFTGGFFGTVNVCAFALQFFLTSWVLRRLGLRTALLALPIGLFAGAGLLLIAPWFWFAVGTELFDHSMNYSIQNTSKELLYLPIDRSIRYKIKPFIDMVMFRFGKGIAAVMGIVLLDQLGMPVRYLSALVLPLTGFWIWIAWQMAHEYTVNIRSLLQARALKSREPGSAPGDVLGVLTLPPSPKRKLALVRALMKDHTRIGDSDLLERLILFELSPPHAYRSDTEEEVIQLKHLIQNQASDLGERRQAIRAIGRRSDQNTMDYLCGLVLVEEEAMLRHEVTRELVKLHLRKPQLQLPAAQIRRQVAREIEGFIRTRQILRIYQIHNRKRHATDPVVGLLTLLAEESVQEVFRLLMLVYRPDDMHLIFEQSQATDSHLRADALELLDNLIDPPMRRVLMPILEEDAYLASLADEPVDEVPLPVSYAVLQEAIWDHNSWLSITTLCLIGRLKLTVLRNDLEKASRHTVPLIASAARAAIELTEIL